MTAAGYKAAPELIRGGFVHHAFTFPVKFSVNRSLIPLPDMGCPKNNSIFFGYQAGPAG